jgi:DNA-binding transcriptional ArsR family regulator
MPLHPHEVFRVLGVSTRLKILEMLKSEGPLPVKTLAERLGVSEPAVSQHLKALRYAGLVTGERQGYWVPYSVDEEALENCCGLLIDLCACHGPKRGTPHHHAACVEDLETLSTRRDQLKEELKRVEERLSEMQEENE